jgi:hypothetical protein
MSGIEREREESKEEWTDKRRATVIVGNWNSWKSIKRGEGGILRVKSLCVLNGTCYCCRPGRIEFFSSFDAAGKKKKLEITS